jgi:hypothetical protein
MRRLFSAVMPLTAANALAQSSGDIMVQLQVGVAKIGASEPDVSSQSGVKDVH